MKHLILFLIGTANLNAAAGVPELMKGLVDIRADLETLNREIESAQKEHQAELDLWLQKKLELESSLQREQLRRLQLSEKTNRLALRVKSDSKTNPQAKNRLLAWIAEGRKWVDASLPFRREHRLETLNALQQRAERGLESIESLAAELWLFYEGEFKMAGENEFKIIDNKEVVRLGWAAMYSRDAQEQIHQAIFADGEWISQPAPDANREDLRRLFQNMKAKKKSGLYNLSLAAAKDVL